MEQFKELLRQIQELAGVALDALEGAEGGAPAEGAGPAGGAPPGGPAAPPPQE